MRPRAILLACENGCVRHLCKDLGIVVSGNELEHERTLRTG